MRCSVTAAAGGNCQHRFLLLDEITEMHSQTYITYCSFSVPSLRWASFPISSPVYTLASGH